MMRELLRRRALPAALLAAALALGALTASLLGRRLPPGGGEEHDPAVRVNDGANWVSILPAEGVPVSELQAEDFVRDGDVIRCVRDDYTVRQGIDVSEFQGEIDWRLAADSGVEFAYLRIGCRGSTEGLLHEDALFRRNLALAQEAGVEVGVYFFSQALNGDEAREEARYVLALLDGLRPALPVMFDWEPVQIEDSRSLEPDGTTLTDCAVAFCEELTAGGCAAGVYFNRQQGYHFYDLTRLTPYTLWLSDPNDFPEFYYAVTVWQYTFSGRVPGIETAVDRDLLLLPADEGESGQ